MSSRSRNWLKLTTLGGLTFFLGLFFAGLLDIPRTSLAQDLGRGGRGAPITPVSAPEIPAARPLAELSSAFSAVAEAVRPSVVFIRVERPAGAEQPHPALPPGFELPRRSPRAPQDIPETSSGSGFVVSADGYILTNHHVIEGATRVRVRLLDGRIFDARVIGSDESTDVGVLKIDATGLTPAALGRSSAVRVGEWVLAIGNPLGSDLTFSVTQGIVSAKGRGLTGEVEGVERRDLQIQDFIQTDAAINRGNSGGPLVNVRGEVIGINSAIASYTGFYAGYAFAVPIDLAQAVMNQIIEHGRVERTALQILVRPATEWDAQYVGLDSIRGIVVNGFSSDESPARRAGIELGEVITAIDGEPVGYVAELQQRVGFRRPGETVRVEVLGANGRREVTARLVGLSGDEAPAATATTTTPVQAAIPGANNKLGILVEPVTQAATNALRVPNDTRGLIVKQIPTGSPLEDLLNAQSRIRYADVITEVEGTPVRTEAEFRSILAKGGRNGIITLRVLSGIPNYEGERIVRVPLTD
ncbi:MAG TPA: trypsin-like peptidase domain-containing protein [Gemmatimonadales bacterium]|nr:trypsin-like peptidase domain-containing protein [Gemmatimonadales bacterium]